jgi:predicted type IV restriction endonuclease
MPEKKSKLEKALDVFETPDEMIQTSSSETEELIIVRASVIINRSVKMAEYKYYKPGIELTAVIPSTITVSEAIAQLKTLAREELQILIDEEKVLYKRAGEVAKLQRIIETYDEGSTEYQLAYKELHGKLPIQGTGDTLA